MFDKISFRYELDIFIFTKTIILPLLKAINASEIKVSFTHLYFLVVYALVVFKNIANLFYSF